MLAYGAGTILFTGATSSIRGRPEALAFSSAKFGVRGLAWSLAREVWPKGIHVAHLIIDGVILDPTQRSASALSADAEDPLLDPDEIALSYWDLIRQPPSAWTFELDLRPHTEEFFV